MNLDDVSVETVVSAAATAIGAVSLAFIPLVLLRKKEASSTIAWILVLVFLPLVGVVLFWFLGRDRVRRPVREKASTNVMVRGHLSDLSVPVTESLEPVVDEPGGEGRGLVRLASRVGRMDVVGGNRVDILVGAPATYDAHVEAIEAARDHVHLMFYIFRQDAPGRRLRDALVAAARRGVRVRLLVDGFGSRGLGSRFLAPLLEAGGHVARFLPLDPVRRAWTINLRNHRKLMVVDGEVGFTGGINVGEEFLGWRDVHLRVRGPAVHQLQTVFVEDWYFAARYNPVHPAFFPRIEPQGRSAMQLVASGPDGTVESIHRLYVAAITSARGRVLITTPYFVPDRALLVALQTTALRGVDVRLILPRQSNHRVTFHAGRSYYDELLDAGVEIHEYLPGMLHTKTMVVDGAFATIGSANLDTRSFRLSFELIAALWDREVAGELEAIFEADLRNTERVDPAQWRRRGVVPRVKEGFGRLWTPLL
ncbi:MAG: cardiolipin synthase [Myxococcota bacterium]